MGSLLFTMHDTIKIKLQTAPDANVATQRAARRHRDGWRALCRALGFRDPAPDGPPIGLCGNKPKIPKHPWRDTGRKRKAPPIYFSQSGYVPSEMVEIQPHVYVNPDFLAGRLSRPKIKHHGRPLGHLKTISVPERSPQSKRLPKHHWQELERLYRDRPLRPTLTWSAAAATLCEPYEVMLPRHQVGFRMLRYWAWRWVGDGIPPEEVLMLVPQSDYAPSKRIAAGGQVDIDDLNDNEDQQNRAAEPGELPAPVGPLIVLSTAAVEVDPMFRDYQPVTWNSGLGHDVTTKYPWQAPLVLAVDRQRAWDFWREAPKPMSISKAKPWERENVSRASWYRRRETTSS